MVTTGAAIESEPLNSTAKTAPNVLRSASAITVLSSSVNRSDTLSSPERMAGSVIRGYGSPVAMVIWIDAVISAAEMARMETGGIVTPSTCTKYPIRVTEDLK